MTEFSGKVMSVGGNKQLSQDDAPYRINSRDYTITSGEHCGLQTKPNISVGGTAITGVGVTGVESSPRFAAGISGGKLVGFFSNPILKTNTTAASTGPMRCFEGKLETGANATRTTALMCILHAMSDVRGTVTQGPTVFMINKGDYNAWESVMEFEGAETGVWNKDPGTELTATIKGYIKIVMDGSDKYIALYDKGALAD